MATRKLAFKPGVNVELSQTLNDGQGIFASNLIRYRMGQPEKIGGWQRLSMTAMIGSVRGLHAWSDLTGVNYLALGSDLKLQVFSQNAVTDITPIRRTANITNPLATTSGSNLITISDAANGVAVGDFINLPMQTAIAGLILYRGYQVVTVIDANTYRIQATANATASVAAGGTVPVFATTLGSNIVTVTLANHGFLANTLFLVRVAVTVGGLTLQGSYVIASIVDANTFTIQATGSATSAASAAENGGQVQLVYFMPSGQGSNTALTGWGTGTWGSGTWGMGVSGGGAAGIALLRNWSLDNFGQDLVALPTGGSLYIWVPPAADMGNYATVVANAPTPGNVTFVAMPQEQVVLLGASVAGVQDPMLIAWCDAGNFNVWSAAVNNQAGSFRLPRGSMIMGGLQTPHVALIWSDIELWSMSYIQPPFIYSFELVASGCGLISMKSRCALDERVFWMGLEGFFTLDANGASPLPCTVWDIMFKDLDMSQHDKIFCAANSNFHEFATFFPSLSGGTGEIDSYVKFNMVENAWDFGRLERLAWVDNSVWGPPIGIDGPYGLMQQHEIGVDADGTPMAGVMILTGYADLEDGTQYLFLQNLMPDFVWTGSDSIAARQLTVTIYLLAYPGDIDNLGPGVIGPIGVTSRTQYVTIQSRARQIALKIQSDGLGVQWRLGAFRYRGSVDGRM